VPSGEAARVERSAHARRVTADAVLNLPPRSPCSTASRRLRRRVRTGPKVPELDRPFGPLVARTQPVEQFVATARIDRLVREEALASFLCSPQKLDAVKREPRSGLSDHNAGMETVGADAVVQPRPSWRATVVLWRARRAPRVRVGTGVRLGRGVVLRAAPGARIEIGAGAALGDGARLEAAGGTLWVGAGSVLGAHASLAGTVVVGRECVVGDWARMEGDARLEDRARLAAHAVALAGARIASGVVVGSYSVVDGPRS